MKETRTAPPAWLPDWKKADHYPCESAPLSVWRWQFLRRRRDYQKDFAALPDTQIVTCEFLAGKNAVKAVMKPASDAIMRKYGLANLLDPASPSCPQGFFPAAPAWNIHAPQGVQADHAHMGYSLCRVDLAQPIDEQIRKLKTALMAEQKRRGFVRGKRERGKWQLYLRVLDAYAAGAKQQTIGSYLHDDFPKPGTVSRWKKAAVEQQRRLTSRVTVR